MYLVLIRSGITREVWAMPLLCVSAESRGQRGRGVVEFLRRGIQPPFHQLGGGGLVGSAVSTGLGLLIASIKLQSPCSILTLSAPKVTCGS